jgi:hypothetical protein
MRVAEVDIVPEEADNEPSSPLADIFENLGDIISGFVTQNPVDLDGGVKMVGGLGDSFALSVSIVWRLEPLRFAWCCELFNAD